MKKVNLILNNKVFKESLAKNREWEKHRKFCHHDMVHMLDTARIAYIINLENKLSLEKEIVYAAALLHDIGRWKQYEKNIPHNIASAKLAEEILQDCEFNQDEIAVIAGAIEKHRDGEMKKDSLSEVIYKGDKLSRKCFYCDAAEDCNWSLQKKNNELKY